MEVKRLKLDHRPFPPGVELLPFGVVYLLLGGIKFAFPGSSWWLAGQPDATKKLLGSLLAKGSPTSWVGRPRESSVGEGQRGNQRVLVGPMQHRL